MFSSIPVKKSSVLCLLWVVLATAGVQPLTVRAAAVPPAADFPLNTAGFVNACKYQVWTNGVATPAFVATPSPAITGLGTPAFSGILSATSVPSVTSYINIVNGNSTWSVPNGGQTSNVCVQWDAYFYAPAAGNYTFTTSSSDGSALFIGSTQVVSNNAIQTKTSKSGLVALDAGFHAITVIFGKGTGSYDMTVTSAFNSGTAADINASLFLRLVNTPAILPAGGPGGTSPLNVTMSVASAPANTVIYYTIDGSTPTASSLVYPGAAIQVTVPNTVKAMATAPAYDGSLVGSVTYTPIADLTLTIANTATGTLAPANSVAVGDTITYTYALGNNGPLAAPATVLTLNVPANTTFVSATQLTGPPFVMQANVGAPVTFSSGANSYGSGAVNNASFQLVVRVNQGVAAGTVITENATATTTALNNSGNDTPSKALTAVIDSDMSVTNLASATVFTSANDVTYTITVTNNGPTNATGVSFSDTMAAGTQFLSLTQTSGPAFSLVMPAVNGNGPISGTLATMTSGAAAAFSLVIRYPATITPPANLSNIASVASTTADLTAANNSVTVAATVVPPPTFTSPPSAAPNPAGVGQIVQFNAISSDASALIAWDFGDGSNGTGAGVAHAYAAASVFTATATASSNGASVAGTVLVTVTAPLVGTGNDSDGDGFSDDFETLAGSSSNDAASTPTGMPATASTVTAFSVLKPSIKLNFAKTGRDTLAFGGTIDIPAGFAPAEKKFIVDVGGVVKIFLLTSKGAAKTADGSVKLALKSSKGVVAAQSAKFTVSFAKGAYAATLKDAGLIDGDATKIKVNVTHTVVLGTTLLQAAPEMTYTAKKGKSGSAK